MLVFRPPILLAVSLVVNVPLALSCEGECIVGITKAFVGNYSVPVYQVFSKLANQIAEKLSLDSYSFDYLQSINDTFFNNAYETSRRAIFPSYFHGKCQDPQTGLDPSGCPNPYCPVICGTPGSLVYHYSELRSIVFNAHVENFRQTVAPTSQAFSKTSSRLRSAIQSHPSFMPMLRFPRAYDVNTTKLSEYTRSEDSLNSMLSSIFDGFETLLRSECGGPGDDSQPNLPLCSWENDMKAYILTFP